MKSFKTLAALAVVIIFTWAGTTSAQDAKKPTALGKNEGKAVVAAQLPSYPLDTCVVSDEPLTANGTPIDFVHEGRLIRLCCDACKKGVKADPAKAVAKIDRAVVAAQQPTYPLEKCLISDEALGSMGDPIDLVHGTRLVRLCCKGCVKSFKKDSTKYMAVVDAALIEQQKASYMLETCIVSGEPLTAMGEPYDYLYGTRLVRLCCKTCVKGFKKEPAKHLASLDTAKRKAKADAK